jgi:hypothetical protein
MTTHLDNTQGLDSLLFAVYAAGIENGQGRAISSDFELLHRREAFINNNPVCRDTKQAILHWVNTEVLDAARKCICDERGTEACDMLWSFKNELEATLIHHGYKQNTKEVK